MKGIPLVLIFDEKLAFNILTVYFFRKKNVKCYSNIKNSANYDGIAYNNS
jgi:hypothetical protein